MTLPADNASDRDHGFLRLLSRNETRLAVCVHALVPDWHAAEDILQDTKIRLWEQFDTFEEGTDFGAWACTVARYMVRTHRKQGARDRLRFSDDVLDLIGEHVAAASPEAERRLYALAQCVAQISQRSRHLLERCYEQGEKIRDIAAESGKSLSAMYTALSRIRRFLMECVESRLQEEDVR